MFLGDFEYKLDEKGRFPLPPRFRGQLKDGLVALPGVERCVVIFPLAEWHKIAQALTSHSGLNKSKQRRLSRALFGGAAYIQMDGQGRITLPPQLRDYAGIQDEVTVVGLNTYIEIWDTALWQEEKSISQEEMWHNIESLDL